MCAGVLREPLPRARPLRYRRAAPAPRAPPCRVAPRACPTTASDGARPAAGLRRRGPAGRPARAGYGGSGGPPSPASGGVARCRPGPAGRGEAGAAAAPGGGRRGGGSAGGGGGALGMPCLPARPERRGASPSLWPAAPRHSSPAPRRPARRAAPCQSCPRRPGAGRERRRAGTPGRPPHAPARRPARHGRGRLLAVGSGGAQPRGEPVEAAQHRGHPGLHQGGRPPRPLPARRRRRQRQGSGQAGSAARAPQDARGAAAGRAPGPRRALPR